MLGEIHLKQRSYSKHRQQPRSCQTHATGGHADETAGGLWLAERLWRQLEDPLTRSCYTQFWQPGLLPWRRHRDNLLVELWLTTSCLSNSVGVWVWERTKSTDVLCIISKLSLKTILMSSSYIQLAPYIHFKMRAAATTSFSATSLFILMGTTVNCQLPLYQNTLCLCGLRETTFSIMWSS